MSKTGEFTVTDELYRISEATNSDGTVDVEVYDFEKMIDEKVKVKFRTPTGDRKSEVMKWPRKDSTEYKFVRLCRKTVGGLNGANWLKEDGAEVPADADDWTIDAELGNTEKIRQNVSDASIRMFVSLVPKAVAAMVLIGFIAYIVGIPIYAFLTVAGWVTPLAVGGVRLLLSVAAVFILMIVFIGILPDPD